VWWCPCYVTVVYVNNWSWHVHGSHSVCLLKPGVTHQKSKNVIYGKETYVGWGVWSSGRWSMATQPPSLSKIAMNDHFQWHWRLTPTNFWPTNGLHEKSKILIYGKKTYVGWSVRASGRWSMATQPPFLSKIAMNDHFQWHRRLIPMDFWPRNGLHHKSKNVIYGKEKYV
jgi:hypothetical protein